MQEFRKVFSGFWIGPTGKEIKSYGYPAQLAAFYLITSPLSNLLGVYHLPISVLSEHTGLPYKAACKAIENISEIGFCTYDKVSEYVWVHNMALYQLGVLKHTDRRIRGIRKLIKSFPILPFLPRFLEKYKNILWLGEAC